MPLFNILPSFQKVDSPNKLPEETSNKKETTEILSPLLNNIHSANPSSEEKGPHIGLNIADLELMSKEEAEMHINADCERSEAKRCRMIKLIAGVIGVATIMLPLFIYHARPTSPAGSQTGLTTPPGNEPQPQPQPQSVLSAGNNLLALHNTDLLPERVMHYPVNTREVFYVDKQSQMIHINNRLDDLARTLYSPHIKEALDKVKSIDHYIHELLKRTLITPQETLLLMQKIGKTNKEIVQPLRKTLEESQEKIYRENGFHHLKSESITLELNDINTIYDQLYNLNIALNNFYIDGVAKNSA